MTEVRDLGGRDVITVTGDLKDPSTAPRIVAEAVDGMSGLDTVVANAGTSTRGHLHQISVEEWDGIYALNVRATWQLGVAALEFLTANGGAFVIVSSISGHYPQPGTGPYSSAKAVLNMLTRHMALEWAPRVRVNAVSPGYTVTPRTAGLYVQDGPGITRADIVPLQRLADPEADIAGVVDFLLSAQARYLTGHNIVVDGGMADSVFLRDPMASNL